MAEGVVRKMSVCIFEKGGPRGTPPLERIAFDLKVAQASEASLRSGTTQPLLFHDFQASGVLQVHEVQATL